MTTENLALIPIPKPPYDVTGSRSTGWWGMVMLITNEAILFASLLASYFYIRVNSPVWPPNGIDRPELLLPAINTIILVSSSFFMHWAQSGIRQGNQQRLRAGLAGGFVLGLIFLGIQLYEYSQSKFAPSANVYASLFFAITGLHGLHVFAGLLMNAYVQVRAGLGHFNATHYGAVENAALYWHFVDAVWIFVFVSLYISPHL
jgi:heme/copper-type cytochrome/quinol oxidase subunit 3